MRLTPHIACGVIEISSLQELLPFVKSQRIPQNVRPIFSKLWHMFVTVPSHNASERRDLNNPRLNAVQSGVGRSRSHHRTAGVACYKAQHNPGAKGRCFPYGEPRARTGASERHGTRPAHRQCGIKETFRQGARGRECRHGEADFMSA